MKKYVLLGSIIVGSFLLNVYLEGTQVNYVQVKYALPQRPVYVMIAVLFNIAYLLYLYISILQFELMKQPIVVRIGHKRYNRNISKRYITQCLSLLVVNFLVDYAIFKQVYFIENLINIALLIALLLVFRKKKQVLDSVLIICIIMLFIMKYVVFSLILLL